MLDFLLVCFAGAVILGALLWCVHYRVKKFGWRGLCVKAALIINGFVLACLLMFHQSPWNAAVNQASFVGNRTFCFIFSTAWLLLICEDWPMRWLLIPILECLIYCCAALAISGTYAAAKGWI